MATLVDVARRAGVSTATVSRVYGRPEAVSERTRTRVLAAATALDYVPHTTAQALARGHAGILGIVIPDLASPYFTPLIAASQARAEAGGVDLVLADSHGDPAREQAIAARLRSRVDGLILASPRATDAGIRALAAHVPVVTTNRVVRGIPSVGIDIAAGMRALADVVCARGHRSVAYLGGPAGSRADDVRADALREGVTAAGVRFRRLGAVAPTAAAGAAAWAAVVASDADAVVAYNGLVAYGLIAAARAAGLRVPGDLGVASADDLVDTGLGLPAMTALHQPLAEVGRVAAELLLGPSEMRSASSRRGGSRAAHRMLSADLVDGATV